MSETILYEKGDGIAKITLNRPKSFNSFNREMAYAMQEALKDAEEDKSMRTVLITGNGKAFSAGQDLKEVTDPNIGFGLEEIVRKHYNPIILQIYNMSKPVIAAVNGVAAGAGANLALVCDITIAAESASFIQAFSKIGLIPDSGGTYVLPRLIGFQKAIALAMLGERVNAKEASELGMIYKYFPDESFEAEVSTIAKKIAALPTIGLAYTKKLYNMGITNNLETQLAFEADYQAKAADTFDYNEGVSAFLEKRKPNFRGE